MEDPKDWKVKQHAIQATIEKLQNRNITSDMSSNQEEEEEEESISSSESSQHRPRQKQRKRKEREPDPPPETLLLHHPCSIEWVTERDRGVTKGKKIVGKYPIAMYSWGSKPHHLCKGRKGYPSQQCKEAGSQKIYSFKALWN